MTTIEGNKLIAHFMGVPHYSANGYENYIYGDDNHRTEVDLYYHGSWEWLMPVVEKIENTDDEYDVRILGQDAEIVDYDGTVIIEMISAPTKIQAVWELVIEFIQWHNEQKDE